MKTAQHILEIPQHRIQTAIQGFWQDIGENNTAQAGFSLPKEAMAGLTLLQKVLGDSYFPEIIIRIGYSSAQGHFCSEYKLTYVGVVFSRYQISNEFLFEFSCEEMSSVTDSKGIIMNEPVYSKKKPATAPAASKTKASDRTAKAIKNYIQG